MVFVNVNLSFLYIYLYIIYYKAFVCATFVCYFYVFVLSGAVDRIIFAWFRVILIFLVINFGGLNLLLLFINEPMILV